MAELRIIHGRKSIKYDHFADYEFKYCRAVTSRLMGVTALRVAWRGKDNPRDEFYQIIHLDYSEYGVDEYREFECIQGEANHRENKREMRALWNHFVAVMGGEVNNIDAPVMMRLIADALPLAGDDVSREYDSDENREFREYALLRIGYMMDALHGSGFSEEDCASDYAITTVSPARLGAYETINYFIMRLVDHDYKAASVLTNMDEAELEKIELTSPGIQTLMKCNIQRSNKKEHPSIDGISYPFLCRATTQARDGYYHSTFIIWLSGSVLSKDPVVTEIRVGSVLKLSDYEAAMQLATSEYITVFGCKKGFPDSFDITTIGSFKGSEPDLVPNGQLFTAYKPDNSHVNNPEYRLEGDVIGHALLSLSNEIVLMSHSLRDITTIDDAFAYSIYAPFLEIKGRYRIDSSVFQTLCIAPGASFDDLVEPGDGQ
ncbi:MAG: hypothetical protein J5961_06475 [Mogibacterium sp.]|nr:hypothetical protein [Mogibacterium sp.]